jgi:hypothetical protein
MMVIVVSETVSVVTGIAVAVVSDGCGNMVCFTVGVGTGVEGCSEGASWVHPQMRTRSATRAKSTNHFCIRYLQRLTIKKVICSSG